MTSGAEDHSQELLHGQWNGPGSRRWCSDCSVFVRLEDWPDHKRELAKRASANHGGYSG